MIRLSKIIIALFILGLATSVKAETDEAFRFRPIPVRAMQVTEWQVACDSNHGYYDWVKFHPDVTRNCKEKRLEVLTARGLLTARVGDWIVMEVPYNHHTLDFFVFTPSQFKQLFEKEEVDAQSR